MALKPRILALGTKRVKSRRLMARHLARMKKDSSLKILTSSPTGKRLLGRLRHRSDIRMDLNKTDINTRNWIDLFWIGIIGEPL